MSESHLRLEVRDDWETVEQDVELGVDVAMDVESHLTGLAWTGIVALVLGGLLVTVAAVRFILGYPDDWYALDGDLAASRDHIRFVVVAAAIGTTAMMLGASAYFVGRRTRGSGRSGTLRLEATR